jgi:hypothetical protein
MRFLHASAAHSLLPFGAPGAGNAMRRPVPSPQVPEGPPPWPLPDFAAGDGPLFARADSRRGARGAGTPQAVQAANEVAIEKKAKGG